MDIKYTVFIEDNVILYILSLKNGIRQEIQSYIHSLGSNPYDEGDFPEEDSIGRPCFCKIIGSHALSFYPDHAVKEMKVFQIARADK